MMEQIVDIASDRRHLWHEGAFLRSKTTSARSQLQAARSHLGRSFDREWCGSDCYPQGRVGAPRCYCSSVRRLSCSGRLALADLRSPRSRQPNAALEGHVQSSRNCIDIFAIARVSRRSLSLDPQRMPQEAKRNHQNPDGTILQYTLCYRRNSASDQKALSGVLPSLVQHLG